MDNQILTKVNSIKYLGIIVHHKLNWLDHITYVKAIIIVKAIIKALCIKLRNILIKTA